MIVALRFTRVASSRGRIDVTAGAATEWTLTASMGWNGTPEVSTSPSSHRR